MTPIDWLLAKKPGYRDLSEDEKEAMHHFVMLWTLFEAEVLRTRANISGIAEIIGELCAKGLLTSDALLPALGYWRDRYLDEGQPNFYFDRLRFRESDRKEFVVEVLRGERTELHDIATALMIIVYRIRNNLFHGSKWSIGMQGQKENFTHSTQLLMHLYDTHEQMVFV